MARPNIHAVVMAGGAGTRFWPLSREARPKPLLRAGGRRSLLGEAIVRARRVAGGDRVWLVCGEGHAGPMRRESGLPTGRVLVEPRMRNTAAAIAFAARHIVARDSDGVMAVLSADHRIPDTAAFAAAMRRSARAAADADALVTLGVEPTRPETAYGYIRLGAPAKSHPGLYRVARFVEKPDARRARRYLAAGGYLWNAGIFAWRARTILEEIEEWAPDLHRAFTQLPARSKVVVERAYRRAPSLPIDTAILERSRRVWCQPVEFHWSDVGTFRSLAEELSVGPDVTKIMDGEAWVCDSPGNLVHADGRPVVLLGVSGLAVIDAGDAVLVADLDRSGEVRDIVEKLRKQGRRELL